MAIYYNGNECKQIQIIRNSDDGVIFDSEAHKDGANINCVEMNGTTIIFITDETPKNDKLQDIKFISYQQCLRVTVSY